MNEDKGQYFKDLQNIQTHLPEKYRSTFGQMILPYYLNLIKSSHINNTPTRSIKHFASQILRSIRRGNDLNKKQEQGGLLVFVAENNHLPQTLPVTYLLSEKRHSITYISNKKQILNNPQLKKYNTLYLNPPAKKECGANEATAFETALKATLAKCSLGLLTEADLPLMVKVYKNNVLYTQKLEKYIQKLVDKLQPQAALIGYDVPVEGRTITDVLNSKKIPTFMIQHGAMAKVDGIFSTHIVKNVFVYGEVSKQVLRESGYKSDIKITGAPYLDSLTNRLQTAGNLARGKLKILVAFSGPGHLTTTAHHIKSVEAIMQIAANNSETIEFYCKLHQKDKRDYYYKAMEGKEIKNVFFEIPGTQSNDIFDWILYTDVTLTGASTVAIEAMLCRKPIISIDFTGDFKELSFIKEGAVKYISVQADLEDTISQLIANNYKTFDEVNLKAARYIKQFYNTVDGQASQRCAQLIEPYLVRGLTKR